MFKRISCVALCMVITVGMSTQQVTALEGPSISDLTPLVATVPSEAPTVTTEDLPDEVLADAETGESEGPFILVDEVVVENASPTVIQNTTYVSLRAVVAALRPDAVVSWEGDHAAVTAEGLNIAIYPGSSYIVANGRYLYLPYGVQSIHNTTMLPIRILAQAFDAQVQWDAETKNTHLITGSGAIQSGEEYYDADALYWLSHIINAESGNQPLDGKIGVGNVILNRVNSPIFPDSIYDVIFQRNQFTPARNGTINREPNDESIIAAKLCLDGAQVLPSALWFNRIGINCWASRNKDCIATIGNHAFYA